MDAWPLLIRVAKLLRHHNLEAILIGNAASDIDFLFRESRASLRSLSNCPRRGHRDLAGHHVYVSNFSRIGAQALPARSNQDNSF
jgi:hypothetical protein